MATQGLLSIVDKDEKVLAKIVVGCNGYNIPKLKKLLNKEKDLLNYTIEDFVKVTKKSDCGCDSCLVIVTPQQVYFNEDNVYYSHREIPEYYKLYRETFDNPNFNPRWEYGTADYIEILKINLKQMEDV